MAVRHLKAPLGFIDLRHAIASIWGRMYTSGVPAWLTEIEEVNAKKIDTTFELTASRAPKNPEPTTLILDALQSKQLKLFVFLEFSGRRSSGSFIGRKRCLGADRLFANNGKERALPIYGFLSPSSFRRPGCAWT